MITHRCRIAAPAKRVFELICDFEKMKSWMTGLEETTFLESGAPGGPPASSRIGARFRQRVCEDGHTAEYQGEITACDPPRLFALHLRGRQGEVRMQFCCKVIGPKLTQLDFQAELEARTMVARLAAKLYEGQARRRLARYLEKLEAVAESSQES